MASFGNYENNPDSFDDLEITQENARNYMASETQYSPQFSTQPSYPSQPSKSKSKKKQKQSNVENKATPRKVWTEYEDERLCKSWCNVSNDKIVGNEIDQTGFWKNIHLDYDRELPVDWHSTRSQDNLRQHFGDINFRVKKCHAKLQAELRKNRSGKNEKDMINDAEIAYYEDENKAFKDHRAFQVLKDQPKWHAKEFKPKFPKKQKTGMNESVSTDYDVPIDIEEEEVSKLERPTGKKAAKKAACQSSSSSSSSVMVIEFLNKYKIDEDAKRDVSIEKIDQLGKAKLLREQRKIMSMNSYASNNTPGQTQWILKMQQDIIAQMNND